jgi:hypothetical protein
MKTPTITDEVWKILVYVWGRWPDKVGKIYVASSGLMAMVDFGDTLSWIDVYEIAPRETLIQSSGMTKCDLTWTLENGFRPFNVYEV